MTNFHRLSFGLIAGCLLHAPVVSAEHAAVFPGRIEALTQVDVSSRVEGIITAIHFSPGDYVKEGDLLFTLEANDYERALRTSLANQTRARALMEEAQQDFDRNVELRERGVVNEVTFLRSKAALILAEAALTEAGAEAEEAAISLERTRIHAPIGGIVDTARQRVGSYADTGSDKRLTTIVDLETVRLAYEVDYVAYLDTLDLTGDTKQLSQTMTLAIELAPGRLFDMEAVPMSVSPTVNPSTGTITVRARVSNPDQILRPGLTVRVHDSHDHRRLVLNEKD